MTVSMTELMRTVRNCFVTGAADGSWRVTGGVLEGDVPVEGWVAIEGRGAFDAAACNLPDGPWQGRVWLLDPPEDFLRLLDDVNEWLTRQGSDGAVTRRRESFGVYATETAYSADPGGWQSVFADRLAPYRRMFPEVKL